MRPTSLIPAALAVLSVACFAACACEAQDEEPGPTGSFDGDFPDVRFENAFPSVLPAFGHVTSSEDKNTN